MPVKIQRKKTTSYLQIVIAVLCGLFGYISSGETIPFYAYLLYAICLGGLIEGIWNIMTPYLIIDDSGFIIYNDMFKKKPAYNWNDMERIEKVTDRRIVIANKSGKQIVIHLPFIEEQDRQKLVDMIEEKIG